MWKRVRRVLGIVGPGVVTGAADDDPSGIATYSQAGAQFGYSQLWLIPFMLPMMVAVQEMCARIGIATGHGIAGVVRRNYRRPLLYAITHGRVCQWAVCEYSGLDHVWGDGPGAVLMVASWAM